MPPFIHESRPGVPYAVVVRQFGRWEAVRREGINAHPVYFSPDGFDGAGTSDEWHRNPDPARLRSPIPKVLAT